MRHVTYIFAIGTLAAAVAGCADPYAPRTGYSQGYNYPSGYGYPANSSYPSGSGYYPTPTATDLVATTTATTAQHAPARRLFLPFPR